MVLNGRMWESGESEATLQFGTNALIKLYDRVRQFNGKYYPEDNSFLLEKELTSQFYELLPSPC